MPQFTVRMKRVIISEIYVEAASAKDARAQVEAYGPDLAVVDFPNSGGTESDVATIVSVKPQEQKS